MKAKISRKQRASSDNLVPMTHGFIYNLGIKFFELKLDFISTSVQCYNNSSPVFFRAAGGSQTESELSRELASGRITRQSSVQQQ